MLGTPQNDTPESASVKSQIVAIEDLVAITYSLDRFARRESDDFHIRKAALCLVPSIIHWADEARSKLKDHSACLENAVPPNHYIRLCTAMLSIQNVLQKPNAMGNVETVAPEVQRMYEAFIDLIYQTLHACVKEHEERANLPPTLKSDAPFEVSHSAYITGSFRVLSAFIKLGIPADDAITTYWSLFQKLEAHKIKSVDLLVSTLVMLCDGKLPSDTGASIVSKLLNEISKRDLDALLNEDIYRVLNACSKASIQHAGLLGAVSDAIAQRSHCLSGITWTVNVLQCLKSLSYHNAAVFEILVRHVNNNIKAATPQQIREVSDCCKALNYDHEETEALHKMVEP